MLFKDDFAQKNGEYARHEQERVDDRYSKMNEDERLFFQRKDESPRVGKSISCREAGPLKGRTSRYVFKMLPRNQFPSADEKLCGSSRDTSVTTCLYESRCREHRREASAFASNF